MTAMVATVLLLGPKRKEDLVDRVDILVVFLVAIRIAKETATFLFIISLTVKAPKNSCLGRNGFRL